MNEHPLCCDCCECLNGAGGYTLPGAGAVQPTPLGAPAPWRVAREVRAETNEQIRAQAKRARERARQKGEAA